MKFIAKTLFGLEDLLVQEIESLGGQNVIKLNRAVSFEGDLECLYKVNYLSRLALRVVKPILEFTAHNETVFYKRIKRYDWTKLFSPHQTFCIDSTVKSHFFRHSKYVALKTKDAIVDLFRLKHNGVRPSIDTRNPDFRINVHCFEKDFTISLDSSGESLHKRGYRQSNRQAPLNEVLAAGMIMLTGWDKKTTFYDPMCGSGTLITEAYSYAHNIPPRKNRNSYAFMKWADFDRRLWNSIVADNKVDHISAFPKFFATDIDRRQIAETRRLFDDLELDNINLSRKNFINSLPPKTNGIIVCNPPYGERLNDGEVIELYQSIGDTLKTNYAGWEAWFISSNKSALKRIGLRPSKKISLFNGSLECKFQKYEMYEGSKKRKE